jgi:hypothetical protein
MAPVGYSGPGGKLVCEKETKSQKSRVRLPLILESGKMIASLHAREDDLYSGYGREDVAPDLDTEGLQFDEGFQVLFSGTLIKKKIKFSSYIKKFRRERSKRFYMTNASSHMTRYLRISSYNRKPFSYMTLQPLPSEFPDI